MKEIKTFNPQKIWLFRAMAVVGSLSMVFLSIAIIALLGIDVFLLLGILVLLAVLIVVIARK